MRVIYYTDQIYLHGGLERVLANKLNYFSEYTNIELHVITFQQENKPPCYPIPSQVQLHDLAICYNRKKSFLHPSNVKWVFKHYQRLKQKIKVIDPDVVVVCNYEYGFYFMPFIAKKAKTIKEYHSSKHFAYLQRQQNKNLLKQIQYRLTDWFEAQYDHLVVLTPDELNYYQSNNKIAIPNSIKPTNHKPAKLENKTVIAAGRIAPVKGFEHAITAWKSVYETHPDWQLHIYGDGERHYIETLQNLITRYGLQDVVHLKGATQHLDQKMQEASIFLMSSLTECFPMVLLEAKQQGLPIVSFDCPNGPRHIIKHEEDGLLTKYLNEEALGLATIRLIENKSLRKKLGQNAYSNVLDFSEQNIMPLWLKAFKYNKLCSLTPLNI